MKTVFLFPGYMSQSVGMAKELYDQHRVVQEYFEEASNCLNINFVRLCFASSEAELARPEHAFPAIFLVSCSIAALVRQEGISPDCVAGYGIGMLSALQVAGAINFPDGLYFLSKYAHFLQELPIHSLIASATIGDIDVPGVADWLAAVGDDAAAITAIQGDNHCVIVGGTATIEAARQWVHEQKGTFKREPNSYALFSWAAKPAVEQLRAYCEKIDFNAATIPVISQLDGSLYNAGEIVRTQLLDTLTKPLRLDLIMQHCAVYNRIISCGPSTFIGNIAYQWYGDKQQHTVNTSVDLETIKKEINTTVA
ncbi:MAG: acyltransferase domain-containing protein [Candidatus Babeliales bacterium]